MLRTCADRVCVKSSLQHVQICPADLLRFGGVLARELAHTTRFFLSTLGPDQLKGVDAEAFEALLQGKRHSLEPDTLLVDVEERDDAAPGDGGDDDATVDAPPPASDSEQTAEDLPKDEVKLDRTEASEAAPPPADLVVEDAPPLREGADSDDDGDETPLQLNRASPPDTM